MTRWLITGATGFVGQHLVRRACAAGVAVRAATRAGAGHVFSADVEACAVGDIGPATEWTAALRGVDTVLHLAGRAHERPSGGALDTARHRQVNADGTLRLASAAADAGVRRFVFVSSIAVHGIVSSDSPLTEATATRPRTAYSRSKLQAEQHLRDLAARSGLEVVVIRPPLVYGPGAPGNFRRLLDIVYRGLPLPIAAVQNRRSLIGIENLTDLLVTAAAHSAAANQTFVVADGEDVATVDMMRRLAAHMRRPFRAWPMPPKLLRAVAWSVGKASVYDQLFGSLTVDASRVRTVLGWRPPATLDDGLAASARWYLAQRAAQPGRPRR